MLQPLCPHVNLIDLKINQLGLGFGLKGQAEFALGAFGIPGQSATVLMWKNGAARIRPKISETRSLECEEKCVGPSWHNDGAQKICSAGL